MARNRLIADVDRRVLRISIAAAALCLVTFLILRLLLLLLDGPSPFDVWLADHIRQPHPSQGLKIVERLAALPGSAKGAAALILGVGAWAWLRRRDVRPGALLIAAFVVTKASVEVLKALLVHVMPIAPSGELEDRAFLSSHVAVAVATFAMIVVVIRLSGHRDVLPGRGGGGGHRGGKCGRAIGDGERHALFRRHRVRGGGRRLLGRRLRSRG